MSDLSAKKLMEVANEGMNFVGWRSRYEWNEKDSSIAYDRPAFEYLSDYIQSTLASQSAALQRAEEAISGLLNVYGTHHVMPHTVEAWMNIKQALAEIRSLKAGGK